MKAGRIEQVGKALDLYASPRTIFVADVTELDARESADGVLYVLPDRSIDRTTNGALDPTTGAEIEALNAGGWFAPEFEGQRTPRLDDFLDQLKARVAGACVEIKCSTETAAGALRETGW